jgi:DNA polymerase-3 subunit beta
MKIFCQQKELAAAVGLASRAVSGRPTHPVLGNLKLETDGMTLTITGFDLRTMVQVDIAADGQPGTWTVNAKMFGDIVNRLPPGDMSLELKEEAIAINAGFAKFNVRGISPEEYPDLPVVKGEDIIFPADLLREAIKSVAFAASTDETKQVLTGVHVKGDGESLELAATDGHRLAVHRLEYAAPEIAVTIPAKALMEVEKMMDGVEEINMCLGKDQISFTIPGRRLTCRVLEGTYPAYHQLIPVQFESVVTVDRQPLLETLTRLSVLSDKNNLAQIHFDKDCLIATTEDGELGNGREQLDSQLTGTPEEFGFNLKYLLESLRHLPGQAIQLKFNQPNQPVITIPLGGQDITHLVMPVNLIK